MNEDVRILFGSREIAVCSPVQYKSIQGYSPAPPVKMYNVTIIAMHCKFWPPVVLDRFLAKFVLRLRRTAIYRTSLLAEKCATIIY